TKGYVCNKAFGIAHYVEHGDRVRHPLRRRPDGTFEQIDWTTAIAEIATRLNDIRRRHSPRAIALVGIGGQGNHMDAPYAMAFLRGTGSRRWFNAFAQEKTQHSLLDQWMFDASPATFLHADTARSRFLLVLGTNPKISNRGHNATDTFKMLAEDPGRTVVVVDPRETETARTATRHLRVKPGTDVYLLLAMAAVIVREGLADEAFVAGHTLGFEPLRPELATVVPEEVLLDHPERIRALVVEGSNPILSYSDASRWREARERLDLLVVIDPAMTETARLADYVLPTPVGYEKWETSAFPRGVP